MSKTLLAAVLILFVVMFTSVAFATGGHVPIIVKPPVVVPPPVVVAPPPPSVAVPPPSPAAAPQPQPAGGGSGPGAMGWAVMGGVAVYFWAVICVKEKAENADGWFAKHMCLKNG